MRFTVTLTCLLFVLCSIFPVVACGQELEKGASFLTVRQALMNEGWQPLNIHEGEKDSLFGLENKLIKAHIKEVDKCAVDVPFCIFYYKKGNECLKIITQGEEISDLKVYDFLHKCPMKD